MQSSVQDPIYGRIEIPELCAAFMHTREWQRLTRIKQLGMTYIAFPSGVHTRAEHCLGVMWLTGLFFMNLMKHSAPEWREYERFLPLVQLAGLMHDVGHGPLSHLFEEAMKLRGIIGFCHEQYSIYLLKRLNARLGLLSDEEVELVRCMILGKVLDDYPSFLFEIVANKKSGLDTDKMDYLCRDAHHLGMRGVELDKILALALINSGEHRHGEIIFRDGARNQIQALFARRKFMYEEVYYHSLVKMVDKFMICAMCQLEIETSDPAWLLPYDDGYVFSELRYRLEHDVIRCLDTYQFDHSCDKCPKIKLRRVAKLSGDVDDDPLNHIIFAQD